MDNNTKLDSKTFARDTSTVVVASSLGMGDEAGQRRNVDSKWVEEELSLHDGSLDVVFELQVSYKVLNVVVNIHQSQLKYKEITRRMPT